VPVVYSTKIPRMMANTERVASRVIRTGAFEILGASGMNIALMNAIDTGNMKNSGHVETPSALRAEIIYSAEYSVYVHEGTHKMGARPFLREAVDHKAPLIAKALQQIVRP
jgi:hypothetical protein